MVDTSYQATNHSEKQRFEIKLDEHLALMEYKVNTDKNKIYIIHTEVPEALGGKGIAKALAQKAIELIKEKGYEAFPACPFMNAYMKKRPELHDLVLYSTGHEYFNLNPQPSPLCSPKGDFGEGELNA